MQNYYRSTVVRLTAAFAGSNGVAADPAVVTFTMVDGSGISTVYVYGTDTELAKDSTGNYRVDWPITVAGVHTYAFNGDGPTGPDIANVGRFNVLASVAV